MPRSPFPSIPIRDPRLAAAAVALVAAAAAGCSGDSCGPGDAPAAGVTLTVAGETVSYGGFTASENNDCTISGAGVISVSVHGSQTGSGSALTLCLPRPDLLGADPVALVPGRVPPQPDDRVQIIDLSASLSGGCTLARDPAAAPSGTAGFAGYCDGGRDPAGYALSLSGQVPLVRTCGTTVDNLTGTLAGRVAVSLP